MNQEIKVGSLFSFLFSHKHRSFFFNFLPNLPFNCPSSPIYLPSFPSFQLHLNTKKRSENSRSSICFYPSLFKPSSTNKQAPYFQLPTSTSNSTNQKMASIKHDLIVSAGEFFGTYLFLLLGEGAAKTASLTHYASSVSPDERPTSLGSETVVFVALSFGLSLMVSISTWERKRSQGLVWCVSLHLSVHLVADCLPFRSLFSLSSRHPSQVTAW